VAETVTPDWPFASLPGDERKALQASAELLARRPDEERVADLEVLCIHSRGQVFAIPLAAVLSITELVSLAFVPRVPPAVRGLVSVRGEVMLALELAAMLRTGEAGLKDLRRVVVLGVGSQRLAVLAERILAVKATTSSAFTGKSTDGAPFVTGVDEEFTSLIAPEALFAHAFRLLERAP
jgi:chemotaxis signal transduction protein